MIRISFPGSLPIFVTPEELLALKAFDLVTFEDFKKSEPRGEIRAAWDVTASKTLRFLKAFRA